MLDLASHRDLPIVLLIDDDMVSREVTATLLTLSGYTVHTAEKRLRGVDHGGGGHVQPGPGPDGCADAGTERAGADRRAACLLPAALRIYVVSGSQPSPELIAAARWTAAEAI